MNPWKRIRTRKMQVVTLEDVHSRLSEVVKNYQDAFYPEYVPDKVAAALLIEFDIKPK